MSDLPQREGLTRREFIGLAGIGALLVALGEVARITWAYLWPQAKEGFGGMFSVGAIEDFPPDSVIHVRKGRFYIVHLEDGLLALYQKCTHLGCLVPWHEESERFACPCHAGKYNREGEVISGPPPRPLDLFKLEIVDGQVVVDTGKVTRRERYDPSQAVKPGQV
ncbi:MAG: ubiquinol-cytochrome c reductase iron-sulfur subunit [Anaerolineae bacterium]